MLPAPCSLLPALRPLTSDLRLPTSVLFPLPFSLCSLLLAPCSLLPAPCSLPPRENRDLRHPHDHQRKDDRLHSGVRPRMHGTEGEGSTQDEKKNPTRDYSVTPEAHIRSLRKSISYV